MLKYLFIISFLLVGFINPSEASDTEQIHFLALDLPAETTEYIASHTQQSIRSLIQKKAPQYSDKILYHTPENIHISLIRFNEISSTALLKKYIELFKKDSSSLPGKNIADKVRTAKLSVTSTGFIVYELPEPKSLTSFVNLLLKDLDKNKLHYTDSDFQYGGRIFPHFSVAYFNPKDISVSVMRKSLTGMFLRQSATHLSWTVFV